MNVKDGLSRLYDAALALAYPQACAVCGVAGVEARADAPACAGCWRATRVFEVAEALCWKCGAPAAEGACAADAEAVRCRRCEAEAFTAARACGPYEGALRAAVLCLKREPQVGARVAGLLRAAQTRAPLDAAEVVVPVPLHPERERERGFNQAALLARALSKGAGLRLDEGSLARVGQAARHRAGMDRRARRETVEGAFRVVRPRLLKGRRVLLVDDVFTTGATASACAAALRDAGAAEVFVLTLARAAGRV
jgi:ComF family protein